ncbi:MAG: CGGC domain-containing protein [Pseudomonadota bacterium]
MAKIGIISCQKIKDVHCIGCLKCFKAMREKLGKFEEHDDIEIVFMSDCGGCPGLVLPKTMLVSEQAKLLERDYDVIHIATCVLKAVNTAACPINLDEIKTMLESKFGKKVIMGTHPW